jgi:hypothetical protein
MEWHVRSASLTRVGSSFARCENLHEEGRGRGGAYLVNVLVFEGTGSPKSGSKVLI